MFGNARAAAAAVLCTLTVACAPMDPADSRYGPDGATRPGSHTGNATVIDGRMLERRSQSVLSVMENRIGSMQVRASGRCPEINLRGQKTVLTSSSPRVYVDGMPSVDTCILDQLRTHDVRRIEVYPMGVTSRAGYQNHPYGLVLVFMRNSLD